MPNQEDAVSPTSLLADGLSPALDGPANESWWRFRGVANDSLGEDGVGERPLWSTANWWGLVALLVVLLTLFGNILLILAISWDRRLQNMTNYFLLSLAVTDLMVASLVMPLSIVVLILGQCCPEGHGEIGAGGLDR